MKRPIRLLLVVLCALTIFSAQRLQSHLTNLAYQTGGDEGWQIMQWSFSVLPIYAVACAYLLYNAAKLVEASHDQ